MITVTEIAKEILKAMLITSEVEPEGGLRLLPSPDGAFVLTLDSPLPGDQVVEYEGFKVLLVGIEYFRLLNGKTIDYLMPRMEPFCLCDRFPRYLGVNDQWKPSLILESNTYG